MANTDAAAIKAADTAVNTGAKVKKGAVSPARYIAVTGILAAMAFVLQQLEIPLPMIMPSFIKFDFSDLPAVIGAFAMGPLCGVLIEFLKNLIHLPFGSTQGIGEISNFLLGAVFVATAGHIYKYKRNKMGALIASLAGAVAMAVLSLPLNYFIVYPLYYTVLHFPEEAVLGMYQLILPSMKNMVQCLIVFNVPFTFVKGIIDVAITFLIYKHISPIIKGTNY